ncbi:TetR/AcrR family transcriptional regulator [Streptomyces sp. CBMA152]|uniref:TetR/AcrR family transcriptional regulator n=1 Tax=Streptomyces sp. CBMA152 TaxID=1896312 RepID=UPI002948C0E3|nr:TetR/AcrR family transcriptional regulator [Streptomyces sp. CBMA152]
MTEPSSRSMIGRHVRRSNVNPCRKTTGVPLPSMGKPWDDDENTAALLAAAEQLLQERGAAALSLREVTSRAGTSTRAVYSLFGSKEALLGALGAHAMEMLHEGVDAIPVTDDPRHDLVEAALMFRRFALDHPALFEVAFQRVDPAVWPRFQATAADALVALSRRFEPLVAAGLLGGRPVPEAVWAFHSLCEGMAGVELRRTPFGVDPEWLWREAVRALLSFAELSR